jgi:hypothetical protein
MPASPIAALLAPEGSMLQRAAALAICLVMGAWLIYVGRANLRTRQAEESGPRELFLSLMGKSTSMQGRAALLTGWLRIVAGATLIVLGLLLGAGVITPK